MIRVASRPARALARTSLALALLAGLACAPGALGPPRGAGGGRDDPFRVSDVDAGDPAFEASLRLVLDGLDADADAEPHSALVLYERALQVDPTNAYAYLAIARHRVEGPDPGSALVFLDKATVLLGSQGPLSPGVRAHLLGLRGIALLAEDRRAEALPLLEEARTLAPRTWSDARLDAAELR